MVVRRRRLATINAACGYMLYKRLSAPLIRDSKLWREREIRRKNSRPSRESNPNLLNTSQTLLILSHWAPGNRSGRKVVYARGPSRSQLFSLSLSNSAYRGWRYSIYYLAYAPLSGTHWLSGKSVWLVFIRFELDSRLIPEFFLVDFSFSPKLSIMVICCLRIYNASKYYS